MRRDERRTGIRWSWGVLAGAWLLTMCWSGTTAAQTVESPVSYTLSYTAQGAIAPVTSATFPVSSVTCGLPKIAVDPASPVANPRRVRWDDPANAANDCELQPTTFLLAVPVGPAVYTAQVIVNGATLSSGWSAPSNPFTRVDVPVAPGGVSNVRVAK